MDEMKINLIEEKIENAIREICPQTNCVNIENIKSIDGCVFFQISFCTKV